MYLTRHASPSYVPPLSKSTSSSVSNLLSLYLYFSVSHYQHIMSISVYCYLLHIAIMWLERYPPRDKPAKCVMAMINWTPLRFLLGLRFSDVRKYMCIYLVFVCSIDFQYFATGYGVLRNSGTALAPTFQDVEQWKLYCDQYILYCS